MSDLANQINTLPNASEPLNHGDLTAYRQAPVDNELAAGSGPPDAQAMSRIDGCPNCVTNTEAPRSWAATDIGYCCAYLCEDCGEAWLTNWRDS